MTTGATPLPPALARAVAAAGSLVAPADLLLAAFPGQTLAARVIAADDGIVELALAGRRVPARTEVPLEPGQVVTLTVGEPEADRVTLRLIPRAPAAPSPAGPDPFERAGLPRPAARALEASLQQAGTTPGTPADAEAVAARARAAGVRTPADAAAFARLEAAGLPATPETVRGFAAILGGSPVGRALSSLLSDAAAAARAPVARDAPAAGPASAPRVPAPLAHAPPPGAPAAGPQAPAQAAAGGRAPAAQTPAAPAREPASGSAAPASAGARAPAGAPPLPAQPAASPVTQARAEAAATTAPATPAAEPHAPGALARTVAQLTRLADALADGAASGDPTAVRAAVAGLGHGIEAALARGHGTSDETLRGHLQQLAAHAGADSAVARAADRLADAVVAQALVGPTLPGADPAATGTPSQGAYLQLPLPGGQSAEVRVNPDAPGSGRDGESRGRRIAFLLHLSALGPVLIEATHGPTGTEAIVRVSSAPARAFLAQRTGELAEALARASDTRGVRVAVERFAGPPPERLVAAPPPAGLELRA